jgi:hypothetical protein
MEVVELASELMACMRSDYSRLAFIVDIDDFDATFQHKKEIRTALTALEQSRAGRHLLDLAIRRDTLGHLVGQTGESLCTACVRVGLKLRLDVGRVARLVLHDASRCQG